MSIESQRSITDWADLTFGPVEDPRQAIRRSVEEMKEFILLYEEGRQRGQSESLYNLRVLSEAAGVIITLNRLASVFNADLGVQVDLKMTVNRQRRWQMDSILRKRQDHLLLLETPNASN